MTKAIISFVILFALTSASSIVFINNFKLVILIHLVIIGFVVFNNQKILKKIVKNAHPFKVADLLITSISIHLLISYFILNYLDIPNWPFNPEGTSFLITNDFYVYAKPIDVLLQQLLISILILKLHREGLALNLITKNTCHWIWSNSYTSNF